MSIRTSSRNPLRHLRGLLHRHESGEAELGDDPDGKLGRRPRRRHPPPAAALLLHIIGEYFLPIRFQLMAPPGTKIEELKKVQSHVMRSASAATSSASSALTAVVGGDTAGSARRSRNWANDPTAAALAPEMAAEAYGLEILRRDVEDAAHNTTRFVILSRDPLRPPTTADR
jgi:prephenate dehydratase